MAQMQEYLKEYIRLMGDEDLKAVQPVQMYQIAAAAAPPANEAPTTNLTASRFQTQPSTTKINHVVAKPVTKPYKPHPSVLNEFDDFDQSSQIHHLIQKYQEPVRPADHEKESSRMYGRDKGSVASLNRNFPARNNNNNQKNNNIAPIYNGHPKKVKQGNRTYYD